MNGFVLVGIQTSVIALGNLVSAYFSATDTGAVHAQWCAGGFAAGVAFMSFANAYFKVEPNAQGRNPP